MDLTRLQARWQSLRSERSGWESAWRDLALHFLPMGWRHDADSQGGKRPLILNNRLLNSVGVLDMRVLAAGLQGGMTSPVRPWFRLGPAGADQDGTTARGSMGAWLDEVTRRMQMLLHQSNFYNAVHSLYADLGTFGTGVMLETMGPDGLHFTVLRAGEYCLDVNSRGEVDTLFRRISMTARQIIQEFGREKTPEYILAAAQRAVDTDRYDVIHALFPREDGMGSRFKKAVVSLHWLDGSFGSGGQGRPQILRESGFASFPAFCPRWDVSGLDVYGRSPAMDVLADCRMLQAQTETLRKMQHKIADPPLAVDASLRRSGVDLRPGGQTFVSQMTGVNPTTAVVPIQQPEPIALQYTMQGIAAVEQLIHDGLYADLFKMLISTDRRQITATEIEAREQEKLILIGPVVERLQKELYAPLIERTFLLMRDWDLLPPLAGEMAGAPVEIEFISVLAQAQRLVSTSSLDQTVSFILSVARANPEILDTLDFDAVATTYAESLGAPRGVVRNEEARQALRQQRAQAQAAEQQQAAAAQAAQNVQGVAGAARDLGQAVTGPDGQTALQALVGGLGGL